MQQTLGRSLEGRSAARLPRYAIENETYFYVGKDAITTTSAWNTVDSCGAFLSTGVTADTWDTIAEVSGIGGYLAGLIGPRGTAGAAITTFRVTVDSRVEVFEMLNRLPASRAVAGGLCYLFNGTGYAATWPDYDPSLSGTAYGQVGVGNSAVLASMLMPADVLGNARRAARFEGYLKVEVKHSVAVAVSGTNANRGCMYAVDGN